MQPATKRYQKIFQDPASIEVMVDSPTPKPMDSEAERVWAPEPVRELLDPEMVFRAGIRNHHIANTAYPIAHKKTVWKYRQKAKNHAALLKHAFGADRQMSLYAHIPFCERRCAFCEYTVIDDHDSEMEAVYHRALMRELDGYAELLNAGEKELVGFDIGGGTPALVDPKFIAELVDRVAANFTLSSGFGISIETTPKIAATLPDRMQALRRAGIERISMGLQMVNPKLLHAYGRDLNKVGHNHRAVENIRRAGFQRFNIDLMYGFARQTREDFEKTLEYTIRLDPEYITLYRMRYKGTRIAGESDRVNLDHVMDMYDAGKKILDAAGYGAVPGKNGFSRVPEDPGTSEYLTERVIRSVPYLGIGLGAQTFTNNILAYNLGAASKRAGTYFRAIDDGRHPIQDLYLLPKSEGMAKMISVAFYFGAIDLGSFRQRFGMELEARFPAEIDFVLDRGLMEYRQDALALTEAGARYFNGVIALFYSDAVKKHLVELEG